MRLFNSMLVLSVLLFTVMAQATIPPLSQEEREAYSSNIVTGMVVHIKKAVRTKKPGMVDHVFTVTMAVTGVEKGTDRAGRISFTFWKAAERPDGWCGPQGQVGMIKRFDEIRVYLSADKKGRYRLIEPNGFDKL